MEPNRLYPCERILLTLSIILLMLGLAPPRDAAAFCGFYVATGDEHIYNRASKVVIARDGDRTVLTMSSDFRGDPKRFAVVIPVPTVLERGQVHIGDSLALDHLDVFSVPRLVEYYDPSPCPRGALHFRGGTQNLIALRAGVVELKASSGMVRVEAQFKVDEYDILILSAKEGQALSQWLTANGYTMPPGAASVLSSYIKQKMHFFVARVDVSEQQRLGYSYLRPIQVAYESPKFMLPIRLGMVNADGTQEMFVFTLTRWGRVESTNYPTRRVPTGLNLPEFVKGEFKAFYPVLFANQRRRQGEGALFLEYAWAVTPTRPTCDPCTAQPLSPEELRSLGAYWIRTDGNQPGEVMLTRLHVSYDSAHFPEDIQFQETGDHQNWQARYVIHHPFQGDVECTELKSYWRTVWARRKEEATNYAELTNESEEAVRRRMGTREDWTLADEGLTWWERIWSR